MISKTESLELFAAINNNDKQKFGRLLLDPRADINCKNSDGKTPLLRALEIPNLSMSMALIRAGCDVNLGDMFAVTPLQRAILKNLPYNLIEELLRKGAYVNAQNSHQFTPLFYAVSAWANLEVVCMLLYYGADVNIVNGDCITALMYALTFNYMDIFHAMVHYCIDIDQVDIHGSTLLHIAACRRSPIAIDLVKAGADVNRVDSFGFSALQLSLAYENSDLFKEVWRKTDHRILLGGWSPFLMSYLNLPRFSKSEWVECLYMLLESHAAVSFIDQCRILGQKSVVGFLTNLADAFESRNVDQTDRVGILYTCLSLGIEVRIFDLCFTRGLYGYHEEVKALIYAGNLDYFSIDVRQAFELFEIFIVQNGGDLEFLLESFWVPEDLKKSLKSACTNFLPCRSDLYKKISNVPAVPSLLELSRNKAQKYIQCTFRIKKLYEFCEVVQNLNLPQTVKDMLILKAPVYRLS